ncbi:MAG: hypothetical protein KC486_05030 [Myxococcales bacterium]|nr:hypothetical protein [Myxococcales bacterium]
MSAPYLPFLTARWRVGAALMSLALGGCLDLGGSWALTTASTSTTGPGQGSTSALGTTAEATSTGASTSSSSEGPDDCLEDQVFRCELDDDGECGPNSGCVDAGSCDPLLCEGDPLWLWDPPCEAACRFGWGCVPSDDPAILRCVGDELGGCREDEVYRCRLDDQGACGPGSGCVQRMDCDPMSCTHEEYDWTRPCEWRCEFGWDCSPSLDPSLLVCVADPADEGCDTWEQNCPEGYKCGPYSEGGGWWSDTRCVPVVDAPKQLGETCSYAGDLFAGEDDCAFGLMCWYLDYETQIGTCAALCGGTPDEPSCPPGSACTYVSRDIGLGLCIDFCDPIAQDCPGGDLCLPLENGWGCVLDASGNEGQFGDPCEYANACDAGLICLNPEYVPDCAASGCCSPLCDINAPNTCPAAEQACIPWYEEGLAPPGLEHIGVCGVPP